MFFKRIFLRFYLEINIDTLNRGVSATIEVLCSSTMPEPDFSTCKVDGVISGGSIVQDNMIFLTKPKQSFFANIFAGGIWTNLAKIPIFLIGGLIILIIIVAPIATVSQYIEKQRRIKRLEGIKDDIDRFIVSKGIKQDYIKDSIKDSFEYFSKLTTPQILVVRHFLEIAANEKENIFLLGNRLDDNEKKVLKALPNQYKLIDLIRFEIISKGREVADYFLQKEKMKSSAKNI